MSRCIEWRRERRRVLLPVLILAPYPVTDMTGIDVMALLDTGSTISGVSGRVAEPLGLIRLGKRPLSSAHGEGQVERYAFRVGLRDENEPRLAPAFPFVFEEVIGIELAGAFDFNVLLGMDILGQCDFEMRRDGSCRLGFA